MYQGNISKILFLDIETAPQQASYSLLDHSFQELWNHKAKFLIRNSDTDTPESIYERAGIYAEFGKVICICCGFITRQGTLRVQSYAGDDEAILLKDFGAMLQQSFNNPEHLLCAHNGKEFDFPYLCRRMIIHNITIPNILNIAGKKPWEILHIDTMELWKFGDYKNYTSLNVLAKCFGIPSPKDDIDGSMVGHTYWQQNDLERISVYCKKDIVTTAQILMKYKHLDLIPPDKIKIS